MLDCLRSSPTSCAMQNLDAEKSYDPISVYQNTKLCVALGWRGSHRAYLFAMCRYNVLFSNELNRRLSGTGIVSNALHPGEHRVRVRNPAVVCSTSSVSPPRFRPHKLDAGSPLESVLPSQVVVVRQQQPQVALAPHHNGCGDQVDHRSRCRSRRAHQRVRCNVQRPRGIARGRFILRLCPGACTGPAGTKQAPR